jgi:acyl-[acyl carrier protein]--UDP-N-acetylglucosamine O-acyltransferase
VVRLSDVASPDEIHRDGEFVKLGFSESTGLSLLVFAINTHHLYRALGNPRVTSVVVTPELAESVSGNIGVLIAPDPRDRFYRLHERLLENESPPETTSVVRLGVWVHPTAVVHPAAVIGADTRIGEFVVIRARVNVGTGVTIEPGAKLGVDGILHRRSGGRQQLIPHGGQVTIGNGAILMSNSMVVSAVFPGDSTTVGEGSLVGMNAVVGHEAHVGRNCVISNNVVLARRSHVLDEAFIGTGAVIREYVTVGSQAKVMAGSVVITDVDSKASVSGNFAQIHSARLREFSRANVRVIRHTKGNE